MSNGYQGQGFIKMHRQFLDWEWYTDIVVKTVFLHCLFRANFKDTEWKGVKIKRGQFITSYPNMAKECGLSISQVRRAISALCSTGEISHKPQARFSIVTVIKYDKYQSDNRLSNSQNDSLTTGKQQQYKNVKNDKNIKKKNIDDDYVVDFRADSENADDDWIREDRNV